jgi:hypothetical protein
MNVWNRVVWRLNGVVVAASVVGHHGIETPASSPRLLGRYLLRRRHVELTYLGSHSVVEVIVPYFLYYCCLRPLSYLCGFV